MVVRLSGRGLAAGIEEEDRWHLFIDTVCAGWIFQYHAVFETGINTLYIAFLRKEKCFRLPPINRSSDTTYRMAAAITQFAGGSTKYFGTNHAELKPACELNCVYG